KGFKRFKGFTVFCGPSRNPWGTKRPVRGMLRGLFRPINSTNMLRNVPETTGNAPPKAGSGPFSTQNQRQNAANRTGNELKMTSRGDPARAPRSGAGPGPVAPNRAWRGQAVTKGVGSLFGRPAAAPRQGVERCPDTFSPSQIAVWIFVLWRYEPGW